MAKKFSTMSNAELERFLIVAVAKLRSLQIDHEKDNFGNTHIKGILSATTSVDKCLEWMTGVWDDDSLYELVRKLRKTEKDYFKTRSAKLNSGLGDLRQKVDAKLAILQR